MFEFKYIYTIVFVFIKHFNYFNKNDILKKIIFCFVIIRKLYIKTCEIR